MNSYRQNIIPRHSRPSHVKNLATLSAIIGAFGGMLIMAAPDRARFRENLESKLNNAKVVTVTTERRGTINRLWVNEGYTTDTQMYGRIIYEQLNRHPEPRLGKDGTTTMTFVDLDRNNEVFGIPYDPATTRQLTPSEREEISKRIHKYSN